LIIDQSTKSLIKLLLKEGQAISLLNDFLMICYYKNKGGLFGIFPDQQYLFISISIVLITLLIFLLFRTQADNYEPPVEKPAYGLILGGALGNLMDRIKEGGVIDFLNIGYQNLRWPTFNVADLAICTGLALMIFFVFTKRQPH
jgi:signal peptidase II